MLHYGGKINRRYRAFGITHSLIAGAYRNGNLDTVDLLYKYGERTEAHEMDEIGYIPGYAIPIIRADGKRQYVPFASKENAYTIYRSLQRVAVDTTENIESLAVQCDNVIMKKNQLLEKFLRNFKKGLTIVITYVIIKLQQ